MTEKILLVDDEPNVLSAYSRTLRRQFDLSTAISGAEALTCLVEQGPFAVIVSDMRMPQMNGLQLLTRAKESHPETIRIMLTGNADQKTAIDAVNQGDVFRFLNKPCPPDTMASTLNQALDQYRLVNAEKEILEKTLKGSIEALSEVLQLAKPEIFGRTTRITDLMKRLGQTLQLDNLWALESMGMLCQLGYVALPEALVSKAANPLHMSQEEQLKFNQHARLASELIGSIPRMEDIAKSLRYQNNSYDGSGFSLDKIKGEQLPIGARLLKVVMDFDRAEHSGLSPALALSKLRSSSNLYDPQILAALARVLNIHSNKQVREVTISALDASMTLAQDIHTHAGTLLACKGQPVSETLCSRLVNFWQNGNIHEKVHVIL